MNVITGAEAKGLYSALCSTEATIPVFSQAWWLDAVAGGEWGVVLIEKGGSIQASLPYVIRRRLGLTLVTQPALTQNLGPWLRPSSARYAKNLAREKDLIQALFSHLPKHSLYKQNWHHSRANWLPLYWQDYEQKTNYTYRINDLSCMQSVWDEMQANVRTDIRKAEGLVSIRSDLPLEEFIKLNRQVFLRQGMDLPYTEDLLYRVDAAASHMNARRVFIAEDEQGRHHAGVYIIWDQESAYYLMGGGDPKLRNSGATSLCMWQAIQFAASKVSCFDFEGSMIEPVERFFRAFGARQTPYFAISKANSKVAQVATILQKVRRR